MKNEGIIIGGIFILIGLGFSLFSKGFLSGIIFFIIGFIIIICGSKENKIEQRKDLIKHKKIKLKNNRS